MMISSKGRYALRVMTDLAEHYSGEYIPMKEVAERQELSLKYLEKILPALTKGGLIEGVHGKGGGYRLVRLPDEYNVWEILCLTEGDLAPVACLGEGSALCERSAECRTLPLWRDYYNLTRDFFSSKKLSDLVGGADGGNYVI